MGGNVGTGGGGTGGGKGTGGSIGTGGGTVDPLLGKPCSHSAPLCQGGTLYCALNVTGDTYASTGVCSKSCSTDADCDTFEGCCNLGNSSDMVCVKSDIACSKTQAICKATGQACANDTQCCSGRCSSIFSQCDEP